MAADDFLFRSLGDDPVTYLRFYRWAKPTASLGYSQRVSRVLDVDFCRREGIDIVRRMTGGKMVLHHREITYSIVSSDAAIFPPRVNDSYRLISEGLIRGLEKMGIRCRLSVRTLPLYARGSLPCFAHPARNEIEVDGRKIVGSAQKRTGKVFLQHGSIPLENNADLLRPLALLSPQKRTVNMTSLSDVLEKKILFRWAVDRLVEGLAEYFQVRMVPKQWAKEEKEVIRRIQKERYTNRAWTFRA